MRITIKTLTDESIIIELETTDTIKKVKEKIKELKDIQIEQQILILGGQLLEDNETLAHYYINEQAILRLALKKIVNFDDNIKDEMVKFFESENINQIDASEYIKNKLKENELNVNLIHFDKNISNAENYKYFINFKINVTGDFKAIDDISILIEYLNEIKHKNIPYIVISSGSSGKDVIPICYEYSFIKEVVIFCRNYKHNEHYIEEYPGYVNKVLISIKQVNEYIKTLGDEYKEGIQKYMDEQKDIFSINNNPMQRSPFISSQEYDQFYFLVHKIYSHFFDDINGKKENSLLNNEYLIKINEYISQLNIENINVKNNIIDKFNKLATLKTNNEFIELVIKEYIKESSFFYLLNRPLRNFGKGLVPFAYFIGPLLFGLNKYVRDNPKFAMTKKMELFKIIKCSKTDFYNFKLNLGHIVCFTSSLLTISSKLEYNPKEFDDDSIKEDDNMLIVKFKFKYIYQKGIISPGIIIDDNIIKDIDNLSSNPKEKRVLLFPFTFAKLYEIKIEKNNPKIINVKFEILNRKSYIEYILKNDFKSRIIFNKLEGK